MRTGKFLFIVLFLLATAVSCDSDSDTADDGQLRLYLTDAPVDDEDVVGVYITFSEIHYHSQANAWEVFDEFDEPVTVNLLDYTRGNTKFMGVFDMPPGTYTQIRFLLEAPEQGQGPPTNPGSYIEFADGTTEPLFVPSGAQSGVKAPGNFSVPANGMVEVTADFDVRKSIVKTGGPSPRYILNPVIRLVVTDQAGRIVGEVSNKPEDMDVVVYAYEAGTYTGDEADDPNGNDVRFPNAVNSDMVCDENMYHIDFLAEGMYDLVVTTTVGSEFVAVEGMVEDIEVVAGETTHQDIDIQELE